MNKNLLIAVVAVILVTIGVLSLTSGTTEDSASVVVVEEQDIYEYQDTEDAFIEELPDDASDAEIDAFIEGLNSGATPK